MIKVFLRIFCSLRWIVNVHFNANCTCHTGACACGDVQKKVISILKSSKNSSRN